jgi:hypothetical protein
MPKVTLKKSVRPSVRAEVEVLALTPKEEKVVTVLQNYTEGMEQIKTKVENTLQGAVDRFSKAILALASVDKPKWGMVLDAAGISETSSYRSSLKRGAANPDEAMKALELTGSVSKAIALLPYQKTEEGKSKGGRPQKSEKQKIKEQTKKALAFLCENYELTDIIDMVNAAHEEYQAAHAQGEEEEELVET